MIIMSSLSHYDIFIINFDSIGNSTAIKEIQKTIQDILNGENSNSDPPTTTSKSDSDNNNGKEYIRLT